MYSRSWGDLFPTILTQRPRFIIQAELWVQTTQEHNLYPEDLDAATPRPSCELIPSLSSSPFPTLTSTSRNSPQPATVLNSSLAYEPVFGSISEEHITLLFFCYLPRRGELKPLIIPLPLP